MIKRNIAILQRMSLDGRTEITMGPHLLKMLDRFIIPKRLKLNDWWQLCPPFPSFHSRDKVVPLHDDEELQGP